ncbi:MAG TPA: CHAT domain-containing protein, partial [Gemmatimonadaceae bacterium]
DARIALRNGDDARVLRVLDDALADVLRSRSRGEWEAHALRSKALARSGNVEAAIAAGRQAVTAAERVRTRITSAPLRTSYTSDRSSVYADLVILLLRSGRVSEAFETADAARGRALVEHLSAARTTLGSAVTGVAAAERETMLRRIDELTDHLRSAERARPRERGAVNASLEYVVEQLAQAERRYEEMLTRSASPDEAAFFTRASAVEIQRALSDGELLIEYLQTPEELLVFAVSRDTVRQLPVRLGERDLAGRVRLARELIAQPGTSRRSAEVLEGLHEVLILPLQQAGLLAGRHSLVVVPHSSLSYLPFAALRSGSTGRYLMQDFALTTLPSAAALPALRSQEDRAKPARTARATTMAPFPRALPATRAEVRAIRGHLPRVRELVGATASERRLREALTLSTIVHIATHGVLNPRNPLFSRIELSPGDRARSTSTDDGELAVHEIIGARVNSELVFLSGCETGSGIAWNTAFDRSEDYASLAQAFMYAGAGGVVATLWRVEDEGAAAFAESFYAALGGTRPAEALAKAQRRMLRHPAFGAPFYWAGYQLAGHDRPLLPKKSRWLPFN